MQVFSSLTGEAVLILITCSMVPWPFRHTVSFTKAGDNSGRLGS